MAAPSRWNCPSEDALYRFSTGDAPRWRRVWLRRHLDRCGECAAQLREWDAATAAYRDYARGLPESESRASVARFEARLRREPLSRPTPLAWSRQTLKPLKPLGWRSLAAAVVIVAGGLFGFLPIQQTITADALVARAVANDRQCPCPPADMVTIAASPHRGDPQVVTTATSTPRGLMSERGAHARELAERLADYAFDWRVPLSARPYQAWRSAITARTESYDWIASDRVRVSTRATSGRIERAELILRTPDYRPVGQTWLFADGFAVELRLSERDAPAAPSAVPSPSPTLNRIAASATSTAPVARTIEDTEIALRVSLERAGVALTRRLSLRHNGESLTIAGRAASRDVRRIAASAREIGGIAMEVRTEARRGAGGSKGSASAGFEAWLDRTFGDSRARAAFLPRAQELSDDFADAVAALDGLSLRFPASNVDGRLSTRARSDVRWLAAAYYARVVASYERLEAHLAPLTGSVSRRILTATPPSHWRSKSATIAPDIRALSAELAVLASSFPTASPDANATADAFERTAGGQLRERLVAVVPQ